MPNLRIVPTDKIDLLRRRQPVCQVVTIYWPSGARYYGFFPVDQWPDYAGIPLKPVEPRLVMERAKRPFLSIKKTAKLQDDVVNLRFVNKSPRYAQSMRSLFKDAGENVPAEVFLWFPQSDYLHSEFTGHLRNPKRSDQFFLNVELVAGYRSPFYIVPSNAAGYAGCVAKFGGECTSYSELAKTPCKYNRQLGGQIGTLDPLTQTPRTNCPKTSEAVCQEVIGDKRYFYGISTSKDTAYVGNGAHKTISRVDAQQSRIKTAVPVPYGEFKAEQLLLLAFTKEINPNPDNADKGSVRHLHLIGEGPIEAASALEVDGSTFTRPTEVRLGEPLQAPTTFSLNVGNFNMRAHIRFDRNPINPANNDPRSTNVAIRLKGRNTLAVLQPDGSVNEVYDDRTSVVLRDAITSERYGWKLPEDRLVRDEWLVLQAWDAEQVKFRDAGGAEYTTQRNAYNGLMQGRPVAQQFDDLCLAAGYTRVFWASGKLHCLPLDAESLADVPTFYASGSQANIAKYGRDSQFRSAPQIQILERSKEDAPLVVEVVFFDKQYGWEKRLLRFEDEAGLRKARENSADTSGLEEPKTYLLQGVTDFGQAVRAGIRLLYLGEFNLGGRRSNLGLQLKIARCTPESLGLHQWQLVRVVWDELADEREEDGTSIEYFYVESIESDPDLQTTLTVWAYPRKTIERLYDVTLPPPVNGAAAVVLPEPPDTPPLVPLEVD